MHDLIRSELPDDGLHTPVIKRHSLEKIQLHNFYVSMFTTAMYQHWEQLAYLGLYSGAGRARLEESGEIVETTALGAFRVEHSFTKYILVDSDAQCIDALEHRIAALPEAHDVTLIQKDVSEAVPDILEAMPRYSRDRYSFVFYSQHKLANDFFKAARSATSPQLDLEM